IGIINPFVGIVKQLLDKFSPMVYDTYMNKFVTNTIRESGLTFADVARKMGVTPQAVHNLATTNEPRPSTLAKFLLALGWNLSDIDALPLGEVYAIERSPAAPLD
ncbi:MAG: helix-turn-helix transcriptional regulator, partial [Rhizobiaceae bacterium]